MQFASETTGNGGLAQSSKLDVHMVKVMMLDMFIS
jgi:hypothetical protein